MFYENGGSASTTFWPWHGRRYRPDQTDLAYRTITNGGFTGVGPGGGQAKFRLPEAHTDYIFSVIVRNSACLPALPLPYSIWRSWSA